MRGSDRPADPRRVKAGKRAAARRAENHEFAAQEIAPELLDVWEMVKWNLPIKGRIAAEAFAEWAEEHPDEIAHLRGKSESRHAQAFAKLERHCVRVAERARKDLAGKGWGTFATFEPLIADQLDECESKIGRGDYGRDALERALRIDATGAPF